jgi:hypothetical protein
LGLKLNLGWNAGAFISSKYPVKEEVYHFGVNESLPTVKYEDMNEVGYLFSPFQPVEELIEAAIDAVNGLATAILDKAKEFWDETVDWFTPDEAEAKRLINTHREYSTQLRNYSVLRSGSQTDFSTIEITIPVNEEAFAYNTKIEYNYYYPGGEVLGATVDRDTFVIISDIVFFKAYHNTDTLPVAPFGGFNVHGKAGSDDLSFLGIAEDYPVSVYHKPLDDDCWHRIGSVDEDISSNSLGTYALGVGVSTDREAPVVNINKNEQAGKVEISITDNMAVYWKSVIVYINGLQVDYTRNQSTLSVKLSDADFEDDLYVVVYASDLARNNTSVAQVFLTSGNNNQEITVTLDKNVLTLPVGDVARLTATVSPAETLNKNVTWSSSNTKVATVSTEGLVTGISVGTATITVTAEDGGKTAACEVSVVFSSENNGNNDDGDETTAAAMESNATPKLYPSPVRETCYLYIPASMLSGETEYILVSASGQAIRRRAVTTETSSIDISGFTQGVYFVIVVRESRMLYHQKFVIK